MKMARGAKRSGPSRAEAKKIKEVNRKVWKYKMEMEKAVAEKPLYI